MGRGDTRTRKGKIFKGSFGKSRPHTARKPKARKASTPKSETTQKVVTPKATSTAVVKKSSTATKKK